MKCPSCKSIDIDCVSEKRITLFSDYYQDFEEFTELKLLCNDCDNIFYETV